jgi:hypothetical protein
MRVGEESWALCEAYNTANGIGGKNMWKGGGCVLELTPMEKAERLEQEAKELRARFELQVRILTDMGLQLHPKGPILFDVAWNELHLCSTKDPLVDCLQTKMEELSVLL